MNDYEEFWPGEGDRETFITSTENAVNNFKDSDDPLPPGKIKTEMARLRAAIDDLSPETREEISSRELNQWQNARPGETWFDDEYFRKGNLIKDTGSALDLLEKSVAEDFKRTDDRDAVKRKYLITRAAIAFTTHGGKIKAGGNSPFVMYVQHLFIDVGMEQADCSKAVRDFLAKNKGVLD